jgi:hypothetical protein
VLFRAVRPPAEPKPQVVDGRVPACGFLKLWRSARSRYGVPTSEMIGIEGTGDRLPEKRPVF